MNRSLWTAKPACMDDDEPRTLATALRNRAGVIIGMIGLLAWFGLVWAMFGDVL